MEFMPEWHRIAEENIRKFVAEHEIAAAIESLCMDAREFEFPAGPLVVYLFNPFPEPVFGGGAGEAATIAARKSQAAVRGLSIS